MTLLVRQLRWCSAMFVLVSWLLPDALQADEPATYAVGAAKIEITPSFPVRLNGFGFRTEESIGINQPIYASALAVGTDADGPAIIVTVDNLGIPADIAAKISARLKAEAGIPAERIAYSASHTHTAPMLTGANPTMFGAPIPAEQQARIDRYTSELVDKIERVALAALADRQLATLSWSIGSVGFARNRRTPDGPVDHDLPVLVARAPDGTIRAIYVGYACHCVTLSDNRISGDWAGFTREMIERKFPGAVGLVSIGCGADANPSSGVTGDRVDVAAGQGAEVAAEVERLLRLPLNPIAGTLKVDVRDVRIPFDVLPTRSQWEERAKQGGAVGYHAQLQLAKLDRGESLRTEIDYPVQAWTFGRDLAMLFLPGEVVVDYSLRLKREHDGMRLWVNSYANGAPGYIPSERILREGGYEGESAMIYYDQPTRFKSGVEKIIIDAVHDLLGESFKPAFNPEGVSGSRPLAPQASLKAIQSSPGFVVELAACEPQVTSPVAIDFGLDGRMWVAEMYDYPSGLDGQFQPGGRVRVLTDKNGDGRFEHAEVFLDDISFPTGVTVWRDGVLVCAAPDILYAEDTDGDGRADEHRVLYTGFGTDNYQGRVNSLVYGLDGWLYGSCGLFGGEITNFRGEKFPLGDRDFRIRPDTGELEPATGRTQQGRPRDDWGNWFGCDSGTLARHYIFEDHDLRRNPHVLPPAPAKYVPDGAEASRLFSIGQPSLYKLSGPPNTPTAVCGLEIYRDELLGEHSRGNAFTCEPVNQLVHRLIVEPSGASFSGRRAPGEELVEFLASTDSWFRPVQVKTGPDGALYVVDMYRFLIEHPRWIPPEDLSNIDARAGSEFGRIYRVYHRDHPPRPVARLDRLGTEKLVAAIDTPNGPQRDLASQILVWRQDLSAVRHLEQLCSSKRPLTRMQALCTLGILGALREELAIAALADAHPAVRRHAVRLLPGSESSLQALDQRRLVDDTDIHVQMAVATKLGDMSGTRAEAMLVELLAHNDPYVSSMVYSSLHRGNVAGVLQAAVAAGPTLAQKNGSCLAEIVRESALLGDADAVGKTVAFVLPDTPVALEPSRLSLIIALISAIESRPASVDEATFTRIDDAVTRARTLALDEEADEATRLAATGLLGRRTAQEVKDILALKELLAPQQSPAMQAAAVEGLFRTSSAKGAEVILEKWPSMGLATRALALDALVNREAWVAKLLDGLEEGLISGAQLDAARRERLLTHPNAVLAARAEALLHNSNADRQSLIAEYQEVHQLRGDRFRGMDVFAKRCSVCHRLHETGHAVGPDLGSYSTKPLQALLIATLDPNQAIDNRYINYTALTVDGRSFTGILTNESGGSITLTMQEGKTVDILRSDLEELKATGKSLMPEGLERDVTRQDFADLFAFFQGLQSPPKSFAGNQPQVVRPAVDGSLLLAATTASLYGGDIAFETGFQNIGMWHGEADLASWNYEVDADGEYDAEMEYACDDPAAGNKFRLEAPGATLEGTVASTGGWDRYTKVRLGRIRIVKGTGRLTLRPSGPIQRALLDLKQVALVPVGAPGKSPDAASLAAAILDDARDDAERERIIAENHRLAGPLIAAMTAGLPTDAAEEYRRIPWIWRVAIAAGKKDEAETLLEVLEVALPGKDEPLRDWQAVVIGGGIINGLSQKGLWPAERLNQCLSGRGDLEARLDAAIQSAAKMADDQGVRSGTRYDALRMLGTKPWDQFGTLLARYLREGNEELQMGGVSGLVDVPGPHAARALLDRVAELSQHNQSLALDGLLRGDERRAMLLDAIESGAITVDQLGNRRRQALIDEGTQALRERARKILGE